MNRIALPFVWGTTIALAFAAGYYVRAPAVFPGPSDPSAAGDGQPVDLIGRRGTGETTEPPHEPSALESVQRLIDSGRIIEAIVLAEEYLARDPYDTEMAFMLSESLAATNRTNSALRVLLPLTRISHDPITARRLRAAIDSLVTGVERQLMRENNLNGLVGFFSDLVDGEPRNDRHRLKLARWLFLSDKPEEAERVLKETGTEGVTLQEIDQLAAELKLAQTSLRVERSARGMFTHVSVREGYTTENLRLLIDTGASMTGIGLQRLRQIGAETLGVEVAVQTANGVAKMPLYRVDELTAGPVSLKSVDVLGLASVPGNADGLLGMDVLTKLPGVQTVTSSSNFSD